MEELFRLLYGKYAKNLTSDEVNKKIKYALTLEPNEAIDKFYLKYTKALPSDSQKQAAINILKQNISNYEDASKPKELPNIFESIGIGIKNVYKGYAAQGPMMLYGEQLTNLNKKINFINNSSDDETFFVGGVAVPRGAFYKGKKVNKEGALQYYENEKAQIEKLWFENFEQAAEIQEAIDKFEKAQIFKNGKLDLQAREIPQIMGEQLPQMLSSFLGATFFQEGGNVMERMLAKQAAKDLNLSEQAFALLPKNEQGEAFLNIINDGRAEDILDKSFTVGVVNQGLDFLGAAGIARAATKVIPRDAWRRALKGRFKEIGKAAKYQGLATLGEVITENAQEIISASTAKDPITAELLLETTAQTIIGAGGIQTSIAGTNIAYNEGMAEFTALTDPKSVSAISKQMRKEIKNNKNISENKKLDLLKQIDIAESLTKNSKFNNLSSEEIEINGQKTNARKLFFEQELARQKIFDKIESLENQLKETPNDLDLEYEINETKLKLADIQDQMNGILYVNNYISNGSKLIDFINSKRKGIFADKQIIRRRNKKELEQYIKNNRPNDLKDKKIVDWLNGNNNAILSKDGTTAYIIDERILNNTLEKGSVVAGNAVHHEVLHMLFHSLPDVDRLALKNEIDLAFKNSNDTEIQNVYKKIQKRLEDYKDQSEYVQVHEFFTAISDVLSPLQAIKNLEQAGFFKKIGDIFSNKYEEFVRLPQNINGKNALELMQKYNSFNGVPLTTKEIVEAGASAVANVASAGGTDVKETLESKLSSEIQQEVANEINNLQKARKEAEDLASKFNKPYQKTPAETKIENSIIEKVKPTVDSFVESRTKALYDPIAPDAKQDVDRGTFKETMKSDIHAMIFEEFKGLQNIEKFITNRGFLRANNLAQRLGIKSVEQGIDQQINEQTTQEIIQEEEVITETQDIKKIKASKIFSNEQYEEAKNIILENSKGKNPEELTYKKLGNITAPITEKVSNVPASKFTNPKSNLTKQEITNGRMFINKNADLILKTRPQGAVIETDKASENLLGTTTGVARSLLNSPLYTKLARGTKGAGLAPFVRNENATKNDLLNLVGKPGDVISTRSPQSQNIKSIIKMFDGAITNEIYRAEVVLDPQSRANLEAGKAEALQSAENQKIAENLRAEWFNIQDKNSAIKYGKLFRKNILPKFKKYPGLLNLGTMINGLGIFKTKEFTGKENSLKRKELREAIKKEILKDKFWVKKGNGYTYGEDIDGVYSSSKFSTERLIKIYKNKDKIDVINKINKNSFYKGWLALFEAIDEDINNITPILHFLENAVSEADHFHRKGAEFVGYDLPALLRIINGSNEKLKFEHALQNVRAYRLLAKSAGSVRFEYYLEILDNLYDNYKLIAISEKNDKKLDSGKYLDLDNQIVSYKNGMGRNWNIFDNSWLERYANPIIAKIDGGFNFKDLIDLDGVNFEQKYNIKNDGTALESLESTESNLSQDLNDIIEQKKGAKFASEKRFSPKKAAMRGKKVEKGIMNFFIPYGAEDFQGLMYALLPKGDLGNKAMEWMRQNLFRPYGIAMENLSRERIAVMNDFRALKSKIKDIPKTLKKEILNGDYTIQDAVRVYIWNKQGMKIPGLTKTDETKLVNFITKDKELVDFANQLIRISKKEGYVKPSNSWDSGTITTDLFENLNTVKRAKYLEKWQNNVNEIFTEENLNKLEAAFGKSYRVALEDILSRMKTGRNRAGGGNAQINAWLEWVNNSVGVIMFLNVRSAMLQMISTVNYINWSDNNPLKAAGAYANQPQFWKDFIFIYNSDFLVERRGGLKLNVNEAELAEQANRKGVRGVISYLLNKGFILTRGADSFAIANGGATFYRNRINTYLKQGLSQKEAEQKAFQDFRELTEEAQQSSRPDRISMQQASNFGRIILAFANTPMQYTRLMKRGAQDLAAGRGDWKTNMSKIMYYGIVQNFIFNALQQALFAIGFGEEDEEFNDNKTFGVANGMVDSVLRGTGVAGNAVMVGKNILIDIAKRAQRPRPNFSDAAWKVLDISPPIDSKITKLRSAGYTFDNEMDKILDEGLSLENPANLAIAQIISAGTNIPLDRVVRLFDNYRAAVASDAEAWQRVALILGWSTWELNIEDDNEGLTAKNNRLNHAKLKIKKLKTRKLK